MGHTESLSILNILDAPKLFRPFFADESWSHWRVVLKAVFGLPMNDADQTVFYQVTQRRTPPAQQAREAWLCIGRRGGKSRIAALLAVFTALFRNYTSVLAPGERGVVMVIAADRAQARVVLGYIRGFVESIPMLAREVEGTTKESIDLANVSIEVHTCSYRAVRGRTVVACIADEVAFWRSEDSANPDVEVLNAVRPGMSSVPDSLLIAISTPYAKRGALWEAYRHHYGVEDDPILFVKAASREMNPTLDPEEIRAAYGKDRQWAAAEYGAEFRSDIEAFLDRELLDELVIPGRLELPPCADVRYLGFVDPSGGSRDSFTLAVAHKENGRAVVDCVRERRPKFSPEGVTEEFAEVLKSYRVREVTGDRYAGMWPREQFAKHGVMYRTSERTKTELYAEFIPIANSGRVELLDHERLISQLASLERRTRWGGKDSIDHPRAGSDDVSNVVAGVVWLVLRKRIRDTRIVLGQDTLRRPSLISEIVEQGSRGPRVRGGRATRWVYTYQ